jgi:hypothetical protein
LPEQMVVRKHHSIPPLPLLSQSTHQSITFDDSSFGTVKSLSAIKYGIPRTPRAPRKERPPSFIPMPISEGGHPLSLE